VSPVRVWLALLALLAATLASAYVPMGAWNSALNLAIAAAKALLIALFFMELRRGPALARLAAAAGLIVLALLFSLSWADLATRTASPAPWSAPR
jgi:cytochrome c oxidase subunit 4